MKNTLLVLSTLVLVSVQTFAQVATPTFDRQDTLRGTITPERAWWDLTYYHLDIQVHPEARTIQGTNTIQYKTLKASDMMQIDLQPPMQITKVTQNGKTLEFTKEGNAHFIQFASKSEIGTVSEIVVHYEGTPKVSAQPPWDGGLTWSSDANGEAFIATSCQGDGASLWWPCKDHPYDEVDSMLISVTVPDHLMDVSNGRLRGVDENENGTKTFHWFVNNPINNYGVNINIADYAHFSETFKGENGKLSCDYYVLKQNLKAAKKQFKQVKKMLKAFEYWFGPYPFYEDGFKLVEVPYLGMEHQSSVTYGNGYQNGYKGRDLSMTGIGLLFDFIIIHEAGHEWFANNITNSDEADMWIHEGFTAYSESLYLEYHFGKAKAEEYTRGTRFSISNDRPIIGVYDVNYTGSSDMYYKGANLLMMLREILSDDDTWRDMLRGLNKDFYHQTVSSKQIEDYLSKTLQRDLQPVFDQYLRDTRIPILEYRIAPNGNLFYRWVNCNDDFVMPVKIIINGKTQLIEASAKWGRTAGVDANARLQVHPNFYVGLMNSMGR